jgi:hypothetical protein
MASRKKRRKQVKLQHRQQQPPQGPFRHRDGDRRRRESMTAAVARAALEKAIQQFPGPIEPAEGPDSPG